MTTDEPSHATRGTAIGYAIAGALLSGLYALLGSPPWLAFACLVGAFLVGVGVDRCEAPPVWMGLVAGLAASLGVPLADPLSVGVLVLLAVGGVIAALLATALAAADTQPLARPQLATRGHQARWAGLGLLWLALVGIPLAFAPTRWALASDMATTLAVLLVAGASVLAFVLPLATLREGRRSMPADELRDRDVRFGVREIRRP